MTGCDARLAAGAAIEVDLKGVLLTFFWFRRREEAFVVLRLVRDVSFFVRAGELFDRSQVGLLGEKLLEEVGQGGPNTE